MVTTQELAVLNRVVDRLSVPERWTQQVLARDKHGQKTPPGFIDATCWCLLGAIALECQLETSTFCENFKTALNHDMVTAFGTGMVTFNDVFAENHEDFITKLKAIRDSWASQARTDQIGGGDRETSGASEPDNG